MCVPLIINPEINYRTCKYCLTTAGYTTARAGSDVTIHHTRMYRFTRFPISSVFDSSSAVTPSYIYIKCTTYQYDADKCETYSVDMAVKCAPWREKLSLLFIHLILQSYIRICLEQQLHYLCVAVPCGVHKGRPPVLYNGTTKQRPTR